MRKYEGIKISEDLRKRADKISVKINEISLASSEICYLTSYNDFFKQKLWQNYDKFMKHFEYLKLRAL